MRDGADVGPLRAKDVGDLVTWAVVGLVSLALLWWGTRDIAELDRAWPWVWVPALLVAAVVFDVVGASQEIEIVSLADDVLEGLALTVAVVLALARWRLADRCAWRASRHPVVDRVIASFERYRRRRPWNWIASATSA